MSLNSSNAWSDERETPPGFEVAVQITWGQKDGPGSTTTTKLRLPPLKTVTREPETELRRPANHNKLTSLTSPLLRHQFQPKLSRRPEAPPPKAPPAPSSRSRRVPTIKRPVLSGITLDQVRSFLAENPQALEEFVLDHVEVERLEKWIIRRSQRVKKENQARKTSHSRWKFCVHPDKCRMLQELTNSLASHPHPGRVLYELSACIASSVGADGFILQLYDSETGRLYRYDEESSVESIASNLASKFAFYGTPPETPPVPDNVAAIQPFLLSQYKTTPPPSPAIQGIFFNETKTTQVEPTVEEELDTVGQMTLAYYVSKSKTMLRVDDCLKLDSRFPGGSDCREEDGVSVLVAPILQSNGSLCAILELYRKPTSPITDINFYEEDEESVASYLVWGGMALHYADMYHAMNRQRRLQQFLLTVVKSIFQDMVSMDMLITKVMNFAQKLVDADRASLFLVDHKAKELYARIFDMGGGVKTTTEERQSGKEIRFPLGTGIAGQVALTGQVLNIPDAYSDPRFNRAVDQQTGYHTRTILCMPIFIRGEIIGVVQMVNKMKGHCFTAQDEEAFEMFAVYCGLALHHAKLYDKIKRSEQRYRVALEVLSYHNSCSEEEVSAVKKVVSQNEMPLNIDEFYFSPLNLNDVAKARCAVMMFTDLFGLTRFSREALIRFVLTVRKNYRRVPYHNWAHGFSVANAMYAIVKHAPETFTTLEGLALFVGSLCHDLDHRGKSNKFMLESASPLAAMYTTSTMEHHHFNQTVTILQQNGHNIFAQLSSEEYKTILDYIKHCILATDLAIFFPNKARLALIVEKNEFNWEDAEHRQLVQAMAMTASDLSASSKPWDIQAETVKVIFEEFYDQGDAERAAGRQPIAMMDRYKPELQPASQVDFIKGICIPCYDLLYQLIPETKPMLDGCLSNLDRWKQLSMEALAEKEES